MGDLSDLKKITLDFFEEYLEEVIEDVEKNKTRYLIKCPEGKDCVIVPYEDEILDRVRR
jgi:hypothetical protein